ncbi:MAG TPA: ABC transporter permease [Planctomycetota bacterium]|nr:ABC transporter permease [Planctomycetota bacterium]
MKGVRVLARLRRDPLFWAGAVLVLAVVLTATFADLVSSHPADRRVGPPRTAPSALHALGTDGNGYDVWSRLAHGARASLVTGLCAVAMALLLGLPLGAVAGYAGGAWDGLLMRATDVMLAFPSVLLALVIAAAAGGGSLWTLVLAVGAVQVPIFARQVRASVMQASQEDWVLACRAGGIPPARTLFRHVLPNCLAPVMVLATLGVGSAILSAAGLSWLGLGPDPTAPEWGVMLQDAFKFVRDREQWIVVPPGVAIAVTVLGFNLLGDALRSAFDPRLTR